jgi:hypothetical protein
MNRLLGWFVAAAALAACGGGSDNAGDPQAPAPPSPPPAPAPAQGTLHVGYYQEDPANDSEDPVPGAFSLNLPTADGSFAGSMFFTYVGCQTSNVGTVSGTKTATALSGTWSGTVDGSAQSGTYSGSYQAATMSYAGTYANAGGKQLRDLRPCIRYTIAANGRWEMFSVEATVPDGFTVLVNGRSVSWSATSGAAAALVYLLDPAIASSSGNPVLWQTIVTAPANSATAPNNITLQTGKEYVAVVGVADGASQRAAFGSKRFTP